MTSSNTNTQSFTLTHAKYLASKVATDLKRMQRLYGSPSDFQISNYEAELTEFLRCGYMEEIIYGFKRNGDWIEPTLRYTAKYLTGGSGVDDDPGRIRPGVSIYGASFGSYMSYTSAYHRLTSIELDSFESALPFKRAGAPTPSFNGYLSSDKSYSSGGKSLDRSSLKNY